MKYEQAQQAKSGREKQWWQAGWLTVAGREPERVQAADTPRISARPVAQKLTQT